MILKWVMRSQLDGLRIWSEQKQKGKWERQRKGTVPFLSGGSTRCSEWTFQSLMAWVWPEVVEQFSFNILMLSMIISATQNPNTVILIFQQIRNHPPKRTAHPVVSMAPLVLSIIPVSCKLNFVNLYQTFAVY